MGQLLAQATGENFWGRANGSTSLWMMIIIGLFFGIALIFGLMNAPAQIRRPLVIGVTFLSGLFYVLFYLWPQPIAREPGTLPLNFSEGVGFWLEDAVAVVGNFSNILTAFLLGLGIYSVARIHFGRLAKMQKDWLYSAVLIFFMILMIVYGYWDYAIRKGPEGPGMDVQTNWGHAQYGRDFLFNGLFQQMNAAMFSMIAFYILSAAYRAFRVRSIEATILLAAALIVMLSLMGAVTYLWDMQTKGISQNLTLTEIAGWIRGNVETPGLRGISFGISIGALAMGLRLWLSLERTGAGS
jgi:hypothetical protein